MRILPLILAIGLPTMASAQAIQADALKWGPAPAIFPAGAKMAVMSGDPGKKGLFIIRLKMPAGYRIPAHHHPSDELVTVISGKFALGMGDRLDKAKGLVLRPAGFAKAMANMNHFAWAETDTIVEVAAEGPFAMTYVNPADVPKPGN